MSSQGSFWEPSNAYVRKVDESSRVTSDIHGAIVIRRCFRVLLNLPGILNMSCGASGFQGFSTFVGDPIKPYIHVQVVVLSYILILGIRKEK